MIALASLRSATHAPQDKDTGHMSFAIQLWSVDGDQYKYK